MAFVAPIAGSIPCRSLANRNMPNAASKTQIIELHCDDADGRVRVVPADKDIMAMSVETAIEACKAYKHQIVFKDQFDLLLHKLGDWASARAEKVATAYLTVRDAGLLFLVMLRGRRYDEQIENDLIDLDLDIANDHDFDLIQLSAHIVPSIDDDSLQSFLSRKLVIRFHLSDGN